MSSKQAYVERIPTGVEALDRYLQGSFPKYSWCFLAGEPGTGKTILCGHVAYTVLARNICPVIYITTEQPFTSLVQQMKRFGMDFGKFKGDGQLHIVDLFELRGHAYEKARNSKKFVDPLDSNNLVDYLWNLVKEKGIREPLIIIDSLSAFWVDKPALSTVLKKSLSSIITYSTPSPLFW